MKGNNFDIKKTELLKIIDKFCDNKITGNLILSFNNGEWSSYEIKIRSSPYKNIFCSLR